MTELQIRAIRHAMQLLKEAEDIKLAVYDFEMKKSDQPFDFDAHNEKKYQKDKKISDAYLWLESLIKQ